MAARPSSGGDGGGRAIANGAGECFEFDAEWLALLDRDRVHGALADALQVARGPVGGLALRRRGSFSKKVSSRAR